MGYCRKGVGCYERDFGILTNILKEILHYGCRDDDGNISTEYGKHVFVQEVSNRVLSICCDGRLLPNENKPGFYSPIEYHLGWGAKSTVFKSRDESDHMF